MPKKEFEAFTRLDASDVNTFLMDQSVMSFGGTAARGSAIATPVEGMLTFLEDSDIYQSYTAGAWVTVADGTGYTTFTPTWSGLTTGNGTYAYSKYKVIGKTAFIGVRFIFGSTSAITGNLEMDLPTNLRRTTSDAPSLATGIFRDQSISAFSQAVVIPSPSSRQTFLLRANNASGTYLTSTNLSSTIPFTWAVNDEISFSATHEVD